MTTTIETIPINQEALIALELAKTNKEFERIKEQICLDYEREFGRMISAFSYEAGQASAAIHILD